MAGPLPAPLHDARALESVRIESELFAERLRAAGLLPLPSAEEGVRALRVYAAADGSVGSGTRQALAAGEKRVHFIRHGQGFHNLLADLYREMGKKFDAQSGAGAADNPYCRPEVLDSPLTELGRSQARALQPAAQRLAPELVVVSPLTRATQTALIGFAHLVEGSTTAVPFVAHEGCHEIAGVHTCDRRRALTELRRDFPQVDYAQAGIAEEDPLWSEHDRETLQCLAARCCEFMVWLRSRPEREIAVASHFAWLFTLLNAVVVCDEPRLCAGFRTGELRSLVLRFEDSASQVSADGSLAGTPATKRAKTE